jgi:hypothetical protein
VNKLSPNIQAGVDEVVWEPTIDAAQYWVELPLAVKVKTGCLSAAAGNVTVALPNLNCALTFVLHAKE